MYIYIYIYIYDRGSIYEISLWRRACFCDAISSIFHNFSNRWRKKGRTRRRNTIPETASRVSFLFCSFSRDISKVWLCEMKNSFNTSKSETSRLCTFSISTSMLTFFNSCWNFAIDPRDVSWVVQVGTWVHAEKKQERYVYKKWKGTERNKRTEKR